MLNLCEKIIIAEFKVTWVWKENAEFAKIFTENLYYDYYDYHSRLFLLTPPKSNKVLW